MTSRLEKYLFALLLLTLSSLASAQFPGIDILTATGVPGTGGNATVTGPCYCAQQAFFSPIMLLQPGTYDFGEVRQYWVQSGATPDGGPDQPNLYLLFSPVETSGTYPDDFPSQPDFTFPSNVLCDQSDTACNARFNDAWVDTDLIFTVSPGENALQIGLVGKYEYTPPVPEPRTCALFFLGLAWIARVSKKRGQPH